MSLIFNASDDFADGHGFSCKGPFWVRVPITIMGDQQDTKRRAGDKLVVAQNMIWQWVKYLVL